MDKILILHAPWFFPLSMCLVNVMSLVQGLMLEGRVKQGALKYTFLYASTIPAAARGDLQPFFLVLAGPPS